ncbi:unnamed protein product [Chondrus crispus]|uniref:Uncharacterized protein n=1 Tax=Chondrus crispus TaxID=2769 RepID=R7QGZ4_CHOCR|nr:unnamed protein product [Chondrus crispus]CDF36993.1 unnamed protein product [Chondrus crispus]|eukprot:XP_005716812.1 unnamed protein product [Chondrus crispus]
MWGGGGHPLFHGVHQAVQVPEGAVVVSAWYRLERGMGRFRKEEPESAGDALAMVLAWRGGGRNDDGLVVQLEEGAAEWRRVCARPEAIKGGGMLHVFFHLHDFEGGHLFVDDVKVEEEGEWSREALQACFRDAKIGQRDESGGGGGRDVRVHLKAEERPGERQLTLAIPLTSDRVLRLEALSRLYGGGPVSAAVAVESESDVAAFRAIWMRKEWLRRHVDVSFVRRGGEDEGQEPLEINALRNVAVQAAGTRFVMIFPAYDAGDE